VHNRYRLIQNFVDELKDAEENVDGELMTVWADALFEKKVGATKTFIASSTLLGEMDETIISRMEL
jgi:hypothetical protein